MRIVIDPGHGGTDPGAINNRLQLRECDLNLEYAMALGRVLRDAGHDVYLTRARDVFVPLEDRVCTSDAVAPALFLSVHCNAAVNVGANGIEVWTSPGQTESDVAADAIVDSARAMFPWGRFRLDLSDGDSDREGKLYVLVKTKAPAVLLELGFISHDAEAAWLADVATVGLYAQSIADGVMAWAATKAG